MGLTLHVILAIQGALLARLALHYRALAVIVLCKDTYKVGAAYATVATTTMEPSNASPVLRLALRAPNRQATAAVVAQPTFAL